MAQVGGSNEDRISNTPENGDMEASKLTCRSETHGEYMGILAEVGQGWKPNPIQGQTHCEGVLPDPGTGFQPDFCAGNET